MGGEKTRKLDTLAKFFKQWEVYIDKTIGQLTEVRTPRRLNNEPDEFAKTRHSK